MFCKILLCKIPMLCGVKTHRLELPYWINKESIQHVQATRFNRKTRKSEPLLKIVSQYYPSLDRPILSIPKPKIIFMVNT